MNGLSVGTMRFLEDILPSANLAVSDCLGVQIEELLGQIEDSLAVVPVAYES